MGSSADTQTATATHAIKAASVGHYLKYKYLNYYLKYYIRI